MSGRRVHVPQLIGVPGSIAPVTCSRPSGQGNHILIVAPGFGPVSGATDTAQKGGATTLRLPCPGGPGFARFLLLSMIVSLADARATPRGRAALRRLFPLYIHDLSAHTTFYKMDERGRWHPELWRQWLVNPSIDAYLIHAAGELAGFAIVGHKPFPHMSPDRDHKLCEFFVLGPHRRAGVGRAAAAGVFDRHPGSWELMILPNNTRAVGFWRTILTAYTGRRYEEVQVPGDIIVRFTSRAV